MEKDEETEVGGQKSEKQQPNISEPLNLCFSLGVCFFLFDFKII